MVSALCRRGIPSISHVKVYAGHPTRPAFGPYRDSIEKRVKMLADLNFLRQMDQRRPWEIERVHGEHLTAALNRCDPQNTLLVMPAGESTKLDQVFTQEETDFLLNDFFARGGRGYFTCGAAYWASSKRIYKDLCEEQPRHAQTIVRQSKLPLFLGTAEGPLCPYPGKEYKVGFYSDAVNVTGDKSACTVYLGGGGSFLLENSVNQQRVSVLAQYKLSELQRIGKCAAEYTKWKNAAIMVSVGKGAALLSMFHPYYGQSDINVEIYKRVFSHCGTDWASVKKRLSPLDVRLNFAYHCMLSRLENLDY